MTRLKPDLSALEARIGHVFADGGLVAAALTHVSAATVGKHETYQRLEFLGDRVLGLVIAEMLYEAFPEADEGELSRRLADLVRKESCAEVAFEWGALAFARLGESEKQTQAVKTAILGDLCESIIGAVFLDAGYEAARVVIKTAFEPRMRSPATAIARSKDRIAGMGAGAGAGPAALPRDWALRSRSCAGIHHLRRSAGLYPGRS